jgi:hypothetical protein
MMKDNGLSIAKDKTYVACPVGSVDASRVNLVFKLLVYQK